MRILLDTNVVLNIALKRLPHYTAAARIIEASDFNRTHEFITASMATDIYYILRKLKGREFAITFLTDLISMVDVRQVDKRILLDALASQIVDFEDAVQNAAAVSGRIEIIVTRNKADFGNSTLIVMTPEEFVAAHLV